jgi:hypothetical protein
MMVASWLRGSFRHKRMTCKANRLVRSLSRSALQPEAIEI